MKKVIVVFVCLCMLTGIAFWWVRNCSSVPEEGTLDDKTLAVLTNNNCLQCHSGDAALPFYGRIPLVGTTVQKDMETGHRFENLAGAIEALKNGKAVDEVTLAKIENALGKGTMPPAKYSALHWTSYVSPQEKKTLLDWVDNTRQKYYSNNLALSEFSNEPIRPIPDSIPVDPQKAALGNKLFHDTRLSIDNTLSCASCHSLSTAGVDNKRFSDGVNGHVGDINAPTVYNSVLNQLQFWDGRAEDLQGQAGGPPVNPVEMGSLSWTDICDKFIADKDFAAEFAEVYPEGITQATLTDAVAEFEKTLLTPNCPFDKYLKGDKGAITTEELAGYATFKANDCATCHVGTGMGGQSFEYIGLTTDYLSERGNVTKADSGRFNFTAHPYDVHRFKTPTLRNVALTAPYFHDGMVETLDEAVRLMMKHQTNHRVSEADVQSIVTFLKTLNGEHKMLAASDKG